MTTSAAQILLSKLQKKRKASALIRPKRESRELETTQLHGTKSKKRTPENLATDDVQEPGYESEEDPCIDEKEDAAIGKCIPLKTHVLPSLILHLDDFFSYHFRNDQEETIEVFSEAIKEKNAWKPSAHSMKGLKSIVHYAPTSLNELNLDDEQEASLPQTQSSLSSYGVKSRLLEPFKKLCADMDINKGMNNIY